VPVPALPPYIIEPIFEQFMDLLPDREVDHPLGCHRSRIPERVVFEKLVFRSSCSGAPTAGSPTGRVLRPRFGTDATSG
jgi:hypothetical protein